MRESLQTLAAPTTPAATKMRSRNAGIDLLRGLSILLVVLHHLGLRIPFSKTLVGEYLPKRLCDVANFNGYEAVFVFFVISGFLIATNAFERWGCLVEIDIRAFYVRRASRILPCLLVLVFVLSVLAKMGVAYYVIERPDQSLLRAIGAALGLHMNWYEGHTGYLPGGWDVLWSLSIEEVFYLGFPLVCLTLRRDWLLVPALALLALSLPLTHAALAANEIWQEKAYLPGMAGIAAGVLAAWIAHRVPRPSGWLAIACLWGGVLGLLAVLCAGDVLWTLMADAELLVLTASSASLVLALHWRQTARARLVIPGTWWLRHIGGLSYEIYLTHMFVVFGVVRLFRAQGSEMRLAFLWYIPTLLLCWGLGYTVARWLSQPCERFLRARFSPVMNENES